MVYPHKSHLMPPPLLLPFFGPLFQLEVTETDNIIWNEKTKVWKTAFDVSNSPWFAPCVYRLNTGSNKSCCDLHWSRVKFTAVARIQANSYYFFTLQNKSMVRNGDAVHIFVWERKGIRWTQRAEFLYHSNFINMRGIFWMCKLNVDRNF